jgi:hypothetical protein
LQLESIVARNDELPSAPVDRELVLLNVATESYVALDEIGRRIWELLEHPRQVGDLCGDLGDEFAGAPEAIATDVVAFLKELEGDGIVRVVADPA